MTAATEEVSTTRGGAAPMAMDRPMEPKTLRVPLSAGAMSCSSGSEMLLVTNGEAV
jgi:hypothetical protein